MRTLTLLTTLLLAASCAPTNPANEELASVKPEIQCDDGKNCANPLVIEGSVLHFTDEAPSILAMLDAIAYAEFRNHPEATNDDAYKTLVGYQRFSNFAKHPDISHGEGDSRAAGRYQFKTATWIMLNRYISYGSANNLPWLKGPLKDFSPASQDKMAIIAMHQRLKYNQLRKLQYGDSATLRSVLSELSYEWASLPGNRYDQGGLEFKEFQRVFWQRYEFYHGNLLASK